MKYHISIILGFAAALLMLPSCEDHFDIAPETAASWEERLQSPQDARDFMNSAYDAMTSSNVWGGQFPLISELMADGIENVDLNGDWLAHYNRATGIFNSTTRNLFGDSYRAAGRANALVDNLGLIADQLSEAEMQAYEGEAKFIRSMTHFDMVRMFGQPYGYTADNSHPGVPLNLTLSSEFQDRSTVGQVYDQIIADLTDAANQLPEDNGIYANAWSAKALLARVYFQMNDFQNAYDYANDVMENSPYTFDDDFRAKYGYGESNEVIFGLISTNIDQDNANAGIRGYHRPDPSTGQPAVFVSSDYALAYALEIDDQRDDAWLEEVEGRYVCTKFAVDSLYDNPLIHLTEIKLIRAESAAELGNNAVAIADLNDIRERAGLVALSENLAGEPLFQQLRIERRKELYFENNRMHELKRIALRDTPGLTIRGADWDCDGMVCQIPDVELRGNPDMEMNPQGGCN